MEYVFNVASKIFLEPGISKKTGEFLQEKNIKKIMMVYDPALEDIGIIKGIAEGIREKNIEIVPFKEVTPDPIYTIVDEAAKIGRMNDVEAVVGIGGGSAMDTAKCANVLLTNNNMILDYAGEYDTVEKKGKFLILIPTTFGTASEITDGGVLTVPEERKKVTIWGKNLGADLALVDPEIAAGLPPSITASTGMDSLAHAIEAYFTVLSTPITDALSLKAVQVIMANLPKCVQEGQNIQFRTQMCTGCLMAGMAFNNAFLCQGHGLAHVLGGKYHIPHGTACALSLPLVIRSNLDVASDRIFDLAKALEIKTEGMETKEIGKSIESKIMKLCKTIGIPTLKEIGIKAEDIEAIADGFLAEPDQEYFLYVPTRAEVIDYLKSIY